MFGRDSQVLALLLLDAYATDFIDQATLSLGDILRDYDAFLDQIAKPERLLKILRSPDLEEFRKEYEAEMYAALKLYGIERKDVLDLAADRHALAFIRRDALRSMTTLRYHQFRSGPPSATPPVAFTNIYEFSDVNILLGTLANSPRSGVSLCLIRDAESPENSYFAFAIKNGERLGILTDRKDWPHPNAKFMTRHPGRHLADRYNRHHFPYDVLDIVTDSAGWLHVKNSSKELAMCEGAAQKLKLLSEMNPDEILWTVLMLSAIKRKFFDENFEAKELSYTGAMVRIESLAPAEKSLVLAGNAPLVVKPLAKEDVSTDRLADQWAAPITRQNEWAEKRYADKVDERLLNLVDPQPEETLMLPLRQPDRLAHAEDGLQLKTLDIADVGSLEDIQKNRRWIARYNMAMQIQAALEQEFEVRKNEVALWYQERCEANLPTLLEYIARGELVVPHQVLDIVDPGMRYVVKDRNILRIFGDVNGFRLSDGVMIPRERQRGTCAVRGSSASMVAVFNPTTPAALAALAGCEVDELVDMLQHWSKYEEYSGNPILSNIDPMEWVVRNRWRKLDLTVCVFLSKSAYNQLRKQHGLPPNRFWDKKGADK